jgi:hypothetical protein
VPKLSQIDGYARETEFNLNSAEFDAPERSKEALHGSTWDELSKIQHVQLSKLSRFNDESIHVGILFIRTLLYSGQIIILIFVSGYLLKMCHSFEYADH